MNITAKNGKRSIRLTKTERNQMMAARETCRELGRQAEGNAKAAALATAQALLAVLAEFSTDAAQSETDGRAEATTAKV